MGKSGSGGPVEDEFKKSEIQSKNRTESRIIEAWSMNCRVLGTSFQAKTAAEIVMLPKKKSFLPRGNGQSFGDVSLPNRGISLSLGPSFELTKFFLDESTGIMVCPAGMTQRDVLERIVPRGWILPVIPGSAKITIGGAVAADAHGKNHYSKGALSDHIIDLNIFCASGQTVSATRSEYSDLFWATIGGLGLTGVILTVTLQLQPAAASHVYQKVKVFCGIREMLEAIEVEKDNGDFLLGAVDGDFSPVSEWRGQISIANFMSIPGEGKAITFSMGKPLAVPKLVGRLNAGAFSTWALNKAIFISTRYKRKGEISLDKFFFPQDALGEWNRLFGVNGFIDYQVCIPLENAEEFLGKLQKFLNQYSVKCFLVAIKRMRKSANLNPLSFGQEGISIALGLPIRRSTKDQLDYLDEMTILFGGRVNLIKDARLQRECFNRMYPRKDQWVATKLKYDPQGRIRSKMSARLGLDSI
jgi:decaprenylphospho-beta-D-ribofuranose 2-oxidase